MGDDIYPHNSDDREYRLIENSRYSQKITVSI